MSRVFLFIVFLYSTFSSLAQPLGFSIAEGKKRVQIPIEINNNLIIVPVVLNGALPLKFILDTGVRTAILTQKSFSDILNLSYSRKYTISGPGGQNLVQAYVTNNVSLNLPGITGRGNTILVLEEDYLELRNYLGRDVHGILGYELFSRFIVQIDYEKKILTIMLPEKFKPRRKYHTIPIRIEDTKPYLTTQLVLSDGTKLTGKLLVDTGASHGLLLEPTSDPRITVPENFLSSSIGRGLGGEIVGKVGRTRLLNLGPYKVENIITRFPDPNSYFDSLKVGNVSRNGSIGGELLSRFSVVFNFPQEEMYIKKNHAFKKKFHYNLSGLTIKAKGADLHTFEIASVRGLSAGEKAGLLPGDIILSVNGTTAKDFELNELNGFFDQKEGRRIRLEINRGGEILKKEIRLTDQI